MAEDLAGAASSDASSGGKSPSGGGGGIGDLLGGGMSPFQSAFGGGGIGAGGGASDMSNFFGVDDPTGSLGAMFSATGSTSPADAGTAASPAGGIGGSQGTTLQGGQYGNMPGGQTPPPQMSPQAQLGNALLQGPQSTQSFALGSDPTVPGPTGEVQVAQADEGTASDAPQPGVGGQTIAPKGDQTPGIPIQQGNAALSNAASTQARFNAFGQDPTGLSALTAQSQAPNTLSSLMSQGNVSTGPVPTAAPNPSVDALMSNQGPNTLSSLMNQGDVATSTPAPPAAAPTSDSSGGNVPASPTWRTDTAPAGSAPGTPSNAATPGGGGGGGQSAGMNPMGQLQRIAGDFFGAMQGRPGAIQNLLRDFLGMMQHGGPGLTGGGIQGGGVMPGQQFQLGNQTYTNLGHGMFRDQNGNTLNLQQMRERAAQTQGTGVNAGGSNAQPTSSETDDSQGATNPNYPDEGGGEASGESAPPAPDWKTATAPPGPRDYTQPNLPTPQSSGQASDGSDAADAIARGAAEGAGQTPGGGANTGASGVHRLFGLAEGSGRNQGFQGRNPQTGGPSTIGGQYQQSIGFQQQYGGYRGYEGNPARNSAAYQERVLDNYARSALHTNPNITVGDLYAGYYTNTSRAGDPRYHWRDLPNVPGNMTRSNLQRAARAAGINLDTPLRNFYGGWSPNTSMIQNIRPPMQLAG